MHQQLTQAFPEIEFLNNEPLAKHTTVGIGGPAEIFCNIKDQEQFINICTFVQQNNIPFTLLGWGANTLIADSGISGLVIKNTTQDVTVIGTNDAHHCPEIPSNTLSARWKHTTPAAHTAKPHAYSCVKIGSGTSLPFAINSLLAQGVTGLEWFARIPATIGGAIYNNIHGGEHLLSEYVSSVDIIDENGKHKTLLNAELSFDYDYSRFHKTNEIIVAAHFKLPQYDVATARTTAQKWAQQKAVQPSKSLGCIFQNISDEDVERLNLPTNSTGYLIDKLLNKKGFSVGGAQVSPKHCAFIENTGDATASEYLAVIETLIVKAKKDCNIDLIPEIFFKGFSQDELANIVAHTA